MGLLINVNGISKAFGADPLFTDISFTISDGDRLGLIGPNGAGKSTLLQLLSGRMQPDDGEIVSRKLLRVGYVAQDSQFPDGLTVRHILEQASNAHDELETLGRMSEILGRVGFEDEDQMASALSGGWRKRLSIAEALMGDPDILLLDEPTNHLDLEAILWLEALLTGARFASVIVSHDRYFLENVANQMAELDRAYPDGLFRAPGNYSRFLERKNEFLHAQSKHQEALENRVKTELEWLRRGPKARTTKSKARIDSAHEMMGELKELSQRTRTSSAQIDFSASDRKTKRLIHAEKISYGFGDTDLFSDLSFTISPAMRVGLVGPNGSGKTTLLKLIRGEIQPTVGSFERADNLRIVYFDQARVQPDPAITLRRALAPDGDSIIYQDRVIHIVAWATRFLFRKEQLDQPVGRLSGGERARVLIANLMLQPADVLLLDEPTNDLDITTLEILEESLLEFTGALVLVTHDRFLLDRVSTVVLGLDGRGGAERFADYSQWEVWQSKPRRAAKQPTKTAPPQAPAKKKLSYIESREFDTIEARIAEAEQLLAEKQAVLQDPGVASDPSRVGQAYEEMQAAQLAAEALYARWAELEAKQA